jgi:tetratricopeptide (TPR) repeat protein/predicted Ser/Thr protein kinase
LDQDGLCAVCLFANVLDAGPVLPETIGGYRILRLLGEGGMGVVYEAEQERPHRTVALKVVKTGLVSPELLRRFTREAEALARLHHPGIAQVYAAGAADCGFGPQPYFAMEFIQGQPLDRWAEERSLPMRERLSLTVQICEAVQHAHQRGIIHRDLKPANILVDEAGNPKILDFGVARMTDSDARATRQTDVGQLVGTLAYMSPEQTLADPLEIDTRSDVYSLGVLLYELLAGRLPYTVPRDLPQAVAAIRDRDPARLGSVSRLYRGDIETIVAKAMEKDKARRYASAAELAADIRRHLEDRPIAARRASGAYQLRKFARRHRSLVAAAGAVFVALVAGVVASTEEAGRARRAERRATMDRDRAVSAERQAVSAEVQAEQASRKAAASEAQALQDRNQALTEKQRADTEAATARAVNDFLQTGLLAQASNLVQATPGSNPDPDLKIRTALDRAAARIEGKFADQPLVEAAIRQTIGDTYYDLGLFGEAERHLQRALDLRRRWSGPTAPDTRNTTWKLAAAFKREGKFIEAEQLLTAALEADRGKPGALTLETLRITVGLGVIEGKLGKYSQAERFIMQALEGQRRRLGEESAETLNTWNALGAVYEMENRHAEAAAVQARVLEIARRAMGPEHPFTVGVMDDLAVSYQGQGKYEQAERLYLEVVEIQRRVRGAEHPSQLNVMTNLGALYGDEGKYEQAIRIFTNLLEIVPRVMGPSHPQTLTVMSRLAGIYLAQGQYGEAEPLVSKVSEGLRRVLGPQHPDTVGTLATVGFVRLELKKYAEAEPAIRESLAADEKAAPDSWSRFNDQILLGACLAGQGKYADAEPLLLAGYNGLIERQGKVPKLSRFYLEAAGGWVVQLYRDWGKPEKAAEWTRKLENAALADSAKRP